MKKVVDYMIAETEAGLFEAQRGGTTSERASKTASRACHFDPDARSRRAQRGGVLPAHSAGGESHADHRPGLPRNRRRLARELDERANRNTTPWILEELAPRPLTDMPRAVLDDMETSQVSIFAVKAQANELRTRMQMTDVVNRRKIRHAHMVNIERRIMLEGMRADFDKVDRISTQVWEMASAAQARSAPPIRPAPTSSADFHRSYKWLKTSGIISPHKWGNLPGGEVFTTPEAWTAPS